MFRHHVRTLATEAKSAKVFNVATPPAYTLASLRLFPSLEPHMYIPLPASFFASPLRKDFLWSSVVYEADKARVGSGNVPTKGDKPFSNKKLRPQKGTGHARTGDANSPHRDNGLKAHGIKAPHNWATQLPFKIYSRGFQTALMEQYKSGKLFIVGSLEQAKPATEFDTDVLDFAYGRPETMEKFVDAHNLHSLNLLFITNTERTNLVEATGAIGKKADVLVKEAVEVRDILRANRVYIELPALQWMIGRYSVEDVPLEEAKPAEQDTHHNHLHPHHAH